MREASSGRDEATRSGRAEPATFQLPPGALFEHTKRDSIGLDIEGKLIIGEIAGATDEHRALNYLTVRYGYNDNSQPYGASPSSPCACATSRTISNWRSRSGDLRGLG